MTAPEIALRATAVVFDFDYTLADSSKGVVACVGYALSSLGLPAVSAARIRRTIGLSLEETFRLLVTAGGPADSRAFRRLFVERAAEIMADNTSMLPFAESTVKRLHRCGRALAIVSTKFRRRIETVLRREGLLGCFAVIVGGEDVSDFKPAPEGLLRALASLDAVASDVLYVGDSPVDAEAAARAGLRFVAVLTGPSRRGSFRGFTPDAWIQSMDELPGLLGC